MSKYILLLALSIFASAPVAGNELLPALYDVTGVAHDDVLNVREGAAASTPIVSTLAPDAQRVEVVQISKDGRWGLVGNSPTSGWVSMRFLEPLPDQDGFYLPRPLYCFGTEPFWSLHLGHIGQYDNLLDTPSNNQQTFRTLWDDVASGGQSNAYGLLLVNNPESIHVVITRTICDDGMSDGLYGFAIHALLTQNQQINMVSGCCSLAPN